MAALTDVETETIEHLDFDIPCTITIEAREKALLGWRVRSVTRPCAKPAVVMLRCKACGVQGYVCAEHRAAIASMKTVTCGRCETTAAGLALYDFIPMGGK